MEGFETVFRNKILVQLDVNLFLLCFQVGHEFGSLYAASIPKTAELF